MPVRKSAGFLSDGCDPQRFQIGVFVHDIAAQLHCEGIERLRYTNLLLNILFISSFSVLISCPRSDFIRKTVFRPHGFPVPCEIPPPGV